MIRNIRLSTLIDQSGNSTFSASADLAFQKLDLPSNLTLDAAAKAAVRLTANNPVAYTYEQAMHGLFVAIYDGFFKNELFKMRSEPTDSEKEVAELAQLIKDDQLSQEERACAIEKVKTSYEDLTKITIDDSGIENLIEFIANPSNMFLGLTTNGETMHGEIRSTAFSRAEDCELIGLLFFYVEQFNACFATLTPQPCTFLELNEAMPAAWQRFKQISPHEYKLPHFGSDKFSEMSKQTIFLNEIKKMKITSKKFKAWFKKLINGGWIIS